MPKDILNDVELPSKKPFGVKVASGIAILKISIPILVLILFVLAKDTESYDRTFLAGFKNAIIAIFNIPDTEFAVMFGYLTGSLIIPVTLAILILVLINNRKFWPMVIVTFIDIVASLGRGIPLLSLILLIIVLTGSTRVYLKNKRAKEI